MNIFFANYFSLHANHTKYSERPQNALLEKEQRAACTQVLRIDSTGLPSNPFPVGHPAAAQSNVLPPKLRFFISPSLLSPNRHMMMMMIAAMANVLVFVVGSGGGSVVHRSRGRAQWGFPTQPPFPSLRRQSPNARPTIALSARGPSISIIVGLYKKVSATFSAHFFKVLHYKRLDTSSRFPAHNLHRY